MNIDKSKIGKTELDKIEIKIQQKNKNLSSEKVQILKTSLRINDSKEEKKSNENKIIDIAKENLRASKSKVSDTNKAKELLSDIQAQILGKTNAAFIAHSNLNQSGLSGLLSS